jgi:hypothetical protein
MSLGDQDEHTVKILKVTAPAHRLYFSSQPGTCPSFHNIGAFMPIMVHPLFHIFTCVSQLPQPTDSGALSGDGAVFSSHVQGRENDFIDMMA